MVRRCALCAVCGSLSLCVVGCRCGLLIIVYCSLLLFWVDWCLGVVDAAVGVMCLMVLSVGVVCCCMLFAVCCLWVVVARCAVLFAVFYRRVSCVVGVVMLALCVVWAVLFVLCGLFCFVCCVLFVLCCLRCSVFVSVTCVLCCLLCDVCYASFVL